MMTNLFFKWKWEGTDPGKTGSFTFYYCEEIRVTGERSEGELPELCLGTISITTVDSNVAGKRIRRKQTRPES
jgi:hypothetical protein